VRMRVLSRLLTAALLGAALAVALVSCGSSNKGLIPTADAGPLQGDFEEVAQAAQNGNGNCTATTEAINKTERDFAALPASVDAGLHGKLNEGISNLRERALALCAQPLAQTNTTTTPRTTTNTTPTPKQEPTTTSTDTTSNPAAPAPAPTATTPTATTPSNNGGGTAAPGSEGPSAGPGGGTGIGGESNEAPTKAQEGGK
jgi:hypothetical protein